MKVCEECGVEAVPDGREKYCSEECAARRKRRKTREKRFGQHRHVWICAKCGQRTKLGRKRVPDETPALKQVVVT